MSLPGSAEAERGLLGCIIQSNEVLYQIKSDLVAGDFIEPLHGEIWLLLRDLIETQARRVTGITLVTDAQDAIVWGEVKCSEYIQRLDRDAPPIHVAASLAQTVREMSRRRRLIALADELREMAVNAPVSITSDELRSKADEAVAAVFTDVADLGVRKLSDIGDKVLERLKKKDVEQGLVPPLTAVRQLIGSLLPGRLYMLGGSPGSGKSALLLQIARYLAREGRTCLLYSIEMGDEEQAVRALSSDTGISSVDLEKGLPSDKDFERVWTANEMERKNQMYIDGGSSPSLASIRGRSSRLKKLEGLDFLCIDHIHYLSKSDRKMSDHEALDENLKGLKQLAKDLKIPIMVVCQYGTEALRDMARWPHRKPTQGDLLFSGIVDRHADVVLLLSRREYFLQRSEPGLDDARRPEWSAALLAEEGWVELILTKRRGGRGWGTIRVGFNATTVEFREHAAPAVRQRLGEYSGELPLQG